MTLKYWQRSSFNFFPAHSLVLKPQGRQYREHNSCFAYLSSSLAHHSAVCTQAYLAIPIWYELSHGESCWCFGTKIFMTHQGFLWSCSILYRLRTARQKRSLLFGEDSVWLPTILKLKNKGGIHASQSSTQNYPQRLSLFSNALARFPSNKNRYSVSLNLFRAWDTALPYAHMPSWLW